MKGAILPDHMPVNKFQLIFIGLPPLTAVEVSGLENELETAEMPDRTRASGGNRKATEITIKLPMHHAVEQVAMEAWLRESQDPVLPTYKKVGTLIHPSLSGVQLRSFQLVGVFPTKQKLPDLEMKNEGEIALVEWTLSVDDVLPLS